MDEGGISKNATNFYTWASFLACNKLNGKYRHISIVSVARRLYSCAIMKLTLLGTRDYFAPHQMANGVPEGT